ncbi:MAG: SMC-Scp complex subunit ScpB, partial [Gemmatimonadaceae bacterium]
EVAEIRGVDVGAVIRSLHERGLIDVVGRSEALGRPLLYGTTSQFLEQFALRHLEELPRVDELAIALRRDAVPSEAAPADAATSDGAAGTGAPTDAASASSPAEPAEAAQPA